MKNKLYFIFLSALILIPTLVNALGLGKLELNSALNEPFDARIQLLSPTLDGLDSLEINLADSKAFERANLNRPFILSYLKFSLQRSVDDEPDYIRVFSTELIREPFLNFLVEINWANGRLYREYTVLLDPPLYDPKSRAAKFTQKSELDAPEHRVVQTDDAENTGVSPSGINYTGGNYGPITDSDTLWSIASTIRPDTSISVNRMMLALLRANPDAFFNQNINGLKRGQILRLPNESELNTFSNARALEEAKSQHAAWSALKDNISKLVTERPETSSVSKPVETDTPENVDATPTPIETNPELKLLAANEANMKTGQASSVEPGLGQDLILAQESIAVLTQENLELKDQIKENEALLNDLKRLLVLKDDELAVLQEQMAAQGEVITEQAEVPVEELELIEEAIEEESFEKKKWDEKNFEQEAVIDAEQALESSENRIMGMINQYLGLIKDNLLGNSMIRMAVGGVLIVLILIMVFMKIRKSVDVTEYISNIGNIVNQFFSNFGAGRRGNIDKEELVSEAVTVLADSKEETPDPEGETDVLDSTLNLIDVLGEESEENTLFGTPEESEFDGAGIEEEPLQEVNTYLVFEQFEQAEEFVRNAINADPENLDYHTKLLEVFYTSGNKKAYEEEAEILNNLVDGEGEHWNIATAMWQEISPTRALFEEGDDKEDSPVEETTGKFVDVTVDEGFGVDDGSLNLDIGAGYATEEDLESSVNEDEGLFDVTSGINLDDATDASGKDELLDITIDDDVLDMPSDDISSSELFDQDLSLTEATTNVEEEFDTTVELDMEKVITTAQAVEDNIMDFEIDGSNDNGDELSIDSEEIADLELSQEETGKKTDPGSDDVIDFELNLDTEEETESVDDEIDLEQTLQLLNSDVGVEIELDDDDEEEEDHPVFIPKTTQSEEQSTEFEVATKLDLAKAYVELGDQDNARTILDEVIVEGNDEQKKQAEDLLGQI